MDGWMDGCGGLTEPDPHCSAVEHTTTRSSPKTAMEMFRKRSTDSKELYDIETHKASGSTTQVSETMLHGPHA